MSSNSKPKRTKQRETTRKFKKKVSILVQERVEYIDYKDVNLLQRFVSDRSGGDRSDRGGAPVGSRTIENQPLDEEPF